MNATINFTANLLMIGSWHLLRLPKNASAKLPSRGMNMAEGTINGFRFQGPLEPDGEGGHWLRVDHAMREATDGEVGATMTLAIEAAKQWPEPQVPPDLEKALVTNQRTQELWLNITTKARWEWIRWIRSTQNPETRKIRIEKACSMLHAGKRRPCCFNSSLCTEPSVSKNGVLLVQ